MRIHDTRLWRIRLRTAVVALVLLAVRAGYAQVKMTEDAKAVRVSNDFLAATLSRDRLHVVGLALADGKTANLLQRVVTIHHSAWEKMPGAASAGLWLEEDSGRGAFARWETKVEPTADAVVASAHTSDQFFKYQRVVRVRADAPFVEVRYVWDCTKTFRTVSAHSIPDVCFDKEVDEAAWEDADGRVEKLLMLQDGKASKAWDEARGAYAYALTVGGHWFAARSTKTSEGLVAFMPTREGVGTRVTTGYTWDPRIHLALAPPLGRRPNPPMPGDKVESHVFLMPFRGEPQEAAQKLVKLLGWTRPEAKPTASSGLARLLLAAPDLTAWHEAPVVKVRRNQQPPAGEARPVVELAAAKDEYESTQIVVRSEKPLREVSLTAGPLVGEKGRIEARDIEINPVGYVRTASPPNEIPDLLLPNREVELAPGRTQPFWVTVRAPREAAAGKYEGVLKLTGAGLGETIITLRLTVHDFALPAERHLRTSFGFRAQYLAAKYGTEEGWRALAAYAREYQRARLSWGMHVTPGEVPRTVRAGEQFKAEGFDEWAQRAEKVIREYACNTFAVLRFPGFPPGVKWEPARQGHGRGDLNITPEVEAVWQAWHREQQAALERKGILEKGFAFMVDEPVPEAIPNVKKLAQMTKAGGPKIKVLVTIAPTPELFGLVDIWYATRTWPFFWRFEGISDAVPSMAPPVPGSGTSTWNFEKALKAIRVRQAAGDEFWWGEFACSELAAEGMEHRMVLWSTWRFGVQGLLYWSVNLWTAKPWESWDEKTLTLRWPQRFPASGDGVILYPGLTGDVPPVRSVRWELLREGMEDFEYLWLAEQAAKGQDAARARRAAAVLEECRAVVPEGDRLRDYLRDPQRLYELRQRLAEALRGVGP